MGVVILLPLWPSGSRGTKGVFDRVNDNELHPFQGQKLFYEWSEKRPIVGSRAREGTYALDSGTRLPGAPVAHMIRQFLRHASEILHRAASSPYGYYLTHHGCFGVNSQCILSCDLVHRLSTLKVHIIWSLHRENALFSSQLIHTKVLTPEGHFSLAPY